MSSAVLIDDGDLAALAAATLWRSPEMLTPLHLSWPDAYADARRAAVRQHAATLGLAAPLIRPAWTSTPPGAGGPAEAGDVLTIAARLLQAATTARWLRVSTLIWPVQVGTDAERVCRAVDLATSVADLVDHAPGAADETGRLTIEMPVVDLDDAALVDLVDDLGAPPTGFCPEGGYPIDPDGRRAPGPAAVRARWQEAFRVADVPWPWPDATLAPA